MEDIMDHIAEGDKKVTAEIKQDGFGDELWLYLATEETAFPLLEEEVEPIMNACQIYLENKTKLKETSD
jgi:hypothetical protein